MPFSWWVLIWESLFLLSLFLYRQELHLNQTSSWLCICLLKSPLFLKPWLHPLCLHMKLSSVWCVIWCCSNLLLNGKLWPQSSQTKQRSLRRYICLSSDDCVANFLSHCSQSTILWSFLWCSFSSLMEPNKSMQILHRMVQAGLLHTGVLLDISTGKIWSFIWLDVSTLETIPSSDGLFEGLDTKLLTLLISAFAWASSLSGDGPLLLGCAPLGFFCFGLSSLSSVSPSWSWVEPRLYPWTLVIMGFSSVSTGELTVPVESSLTKSSSLCTTTLRSFKLGMASELLISESSQTSVSTFTVLVTIVVSTLAGIFSIVSCTGFSIGCVKSDRVSVPSEFTDGGADSDWIIVSTCSSDSLSGVELSPEVVGLSKVNSLIILNCPSLGLTGCGLCGCQRRVPNFKFPRYRSWTEHSFIIYSSKCILTSLALSPLKLLNSS